jgi:hypothetical protein
MDSMILAYSISGYDPTDSLARKRASLALEPTRARRLELIEVWIAIDNITAAEVEVLRREVKRGRIGR